MDAGRQAAHRSLHQAFEAVGGDVCAAPGAMVAGGTQNVCSFQGHDASIVGCMSEILPAPSPSDKWVNTPNGGWHHAARGAAAVSPGHGLGCPTHSTLTVRECLPDLSELLA